MSKGKTPRESAVESRYLVMPNHINPGGTAFGGEIVRWIDIVAAMVASKHCGKDVSDIVTACIDSVSFVAPVYDGDQVVLKASVNYVGRTSMEIGVKVLKENPKSGEKTLVTRAYLTFVALDENKKPCPVTPLISKTKNDKRRHKNAKLRVRARKQLLQKIKESRK